MLIVSHPQPARMSVEQITAPAVLCNSILFIYQIHPDLFHSWCTEGADDVLDRLAQRLQTDGQSRAGGHPPSDRRQQS